MPVVFRFLIFRARATVGKTYWPVLFPLSMRAKRGKNHITSNGFLS